MSIFKGFSNEWLCYDTTNDVWLRSSDIGRPKVRLAFGRVSCIYIAASYGYPNIPKEMPWCFNLLPPGCHEPRSVEHPQFPELTPWIHAHKRATRNFLGDIPWTTSLSIISSIAYLQAHRVHPPLQCLSSNLTRTFLVFLTGRVLSLKTSAFCLYHDGSDMM